MIRQAGRARTRCALFAIALMALGASSCSNEIRVRISGAAPGEEDYVNQQPPYAAEFCLPTSYSDGNFTGVPDSGAVAIKFLHPSRAPGGRNRRAPGFVRVSVWPRPNDGRRYDYSRVVFPTYCESLQHPHMNPPSRAIQEVVGARDRTASSVFPSFHGSYLVAPIDEDWRRRVRVRCHRFSTSPSDWCTATFQTSRGFRVYVGATTETMNDLPSVIVSVETLVERFLAACRR